MSEIIYTIISDSRTALLSVFISLACLTAVVVNSVSDWGKMPNESIAHQSVAVKTETVTLVPDNIAKMHLFGVAPTIADTLPKTKLALKLEGVLLSADAIHSSAIIAPTGGVSSVYSLGEVLPNGATLDQITDEFVVLKTQGRLEKLLLDRAFVSMQAMPVSTLR